MLKRCNFSNKEASKWYQIRCPKEEGIETKTTSNTNPKCATNVLPICTNSRANSLACSLLLIEQRLPPSKALVKHLRPPN